MIKRRAASRARVRAKVTAPKYGFWQRVADNVHGYQDARANRNVDVHDLAWRDRLLASAAETDNHMLERVQDDAAVLVIRLRSGVEYVRELDRRAALARGRLDEVPVANVSQIGGAEMHLPPEAVALRRRREADRRRVSIQAEIDRLDAESARLTSECLRLEAELVERFDLAKSMSERNRQFFARRLSTYVRQVERRRKTPIRRIAVDPPEWASQQCPWIPAAPYGLDSAGDRSS